MTQKEKINYYIKCSQQSGIRKTIEFLIKVIDGYRAESVELNGKNFRKQVN